MAGQARVGGPGGRELELAGVLLKLQAQRGVAEVPAQHGALGVGFDTPPDPANSVESPQPQGQQVQQKLSPPQQQLLAQQATIVDQQSMKITSWAWFEYPARSDKNHRLCPDAKGLSVRKEPGDEAAAPTPTPTPKCDPRSEAEVELAGWKPRAQLGPLAIDKAEGYFWADGDKLRAAVLLDVRTPDTKDYKLTLFGPGAPRESYTVLSPDQEVLEVTLDAAKVGERKSYPMYLQIERNTAGLPKDGSVPLIRHDRGLEHEWVAASAIDEALDDRVGDGRADRLASESLGVSERLPRRISWTL